MSPRLPEWTDPAQPWWRRPTCSPAQTWLALPAPPPAQHRNWFGCIWFPRPGCAVSQSPGPRLATAGTECSLETPGRALLFWASGREAWPRPGGSVPQSPWRGFLCCSQNLNSAQCLFPHPQSASQRRSRPQHPHPPWASGLRASFPASLGPQHPCSPPSGTKALHALWLGSVPGGPAFVGGLCTPRGGGPWGPKAPP